MTVLWSSLFVSIAIITASSHFIGPWGVVEISMVLLLPHLLIGDTFGATSPNRPPAKRFLTLTFIGIFAINVIRYGTGTPLALFYIYFFGHFWKDLDLVFTDGTPHKQATRNAKRWIGGILFTAFTVISSGVIRDERTIQIGAQAALYATPLFVLAALYQWVRMKRSREEWRLEWVRYCAFAALFLPLCSWFNANSAFPYVMPHGVIIWHFMIWYAFYLRELWRAESLPYDNNIILWAKSSLTGFLTVVLSVNAVFGLGGWFLYGPMDVSWLRFIYHFDHIAGAWTVLHVSWDWVPKEIRGVRLAVF